jgi:hypothetical protein
MAADEEFDRIGVRDDYGTETRRNGRLRDESAVYEAHSGAGVRESMPAVAGSSRATGSPLPMGSAGRPLSGRGEGQGTRTTAPPPGRALSVPPNSEGEAANSGMQWMMGVMKQAVPFVQKLLPLLEGQFATAVANVLTTRPHTPPPAPRLDLQPIENGLAELQVQQANLKDQLADQNTSLKRVEDHLEMVREATDRNTLEQQELIEDLKTISGRVNRMALLFLLLMVISVVLNIFLFLHIQRVLP